MPDAVAAGALPYRTTDAVRDGKEIDAAAADGRRYLASENHLAREGSMKVGILAGRAADAGALIVQADDVDHTGERMIGLRPVHCRGRRTRAVLLMHDVDELARHERAGGAGHLLADFIPDAPEKHRRMIAIAMDHR